MHLSCCNDMQSKLTMGNPTKPVKYIGTMATQKPAISYESHRDIILCVCVLNGKALWCVLSAQRWFMARLSSRTARNSLTQQWWKIYNRHNTTHNGPPLRPRLSVCVFGLCLWGATASCPRRLTSSLPCTTLWLWCVYCWYHYT